MILDNAFYILNAKLSNNKQELKEIFDNAMLSNINEQELYYCYGQINNSNKRIGQELAFLFIDYNKEQIKAFIDFFSYIPNLDNFEMISEDFDLLSICNLMLEIITNLKVLDKEVFEDWVFNLVKKIEELEEYEILDLVNEKREQAGFNELSEELLESELKNHKENYSKLLNNSLKKFPLSDARSIMKNLVIKSVDEYGIEFPYLINKLLNFYELEGRKNLELLYRDIEQNIEQLKKSLFFKEKKRKIVLENLIKKIEEGREIIKPINLFFTAQSRKDRFSEELFNLVFNSEIIDIFYDNDEKELFLYYCEKIENFFADIDYLIEEFKELKANISLWFLACDF